MRGVRAAMGLGVNWPYISRGANWRFDLYPTPGAKIFAHDPNDRAWNAPYLGQGEEAARAWPFKRAQGQPVGRVTALAGGAAGGLNRQSGRVAGRGCVCYSRPLVSRASGRAGVWCRSPGWGAVKG